MSASDEQQQTQQQPPQQQQQLGVCPRNLTSDVAGRLSKLSSLLSRKSTSEASRDRQDAAVLSELTKMKDHIEARVEYLRGQVALASAEDIDVEEALLFGSGDFLEDQLFPSLEDGLGEDGLFGADFLQDIPQPQPPPPLLPPPPPPPPPPPAKRKRVDDGGKKKRKRTRAYVRLRIRCCGQILDAATASIFTDSPFALTLTSNQLQKRKKAASGPAAPPEEPLDLELGPPTRTENGATTRAVWTWLEDAYRKADLPLLLRSVTGDDDDDDPAKAPYSVSPLLSSVLADDDDDDIGVGTLPPPFSATTNENGDDDAIRGSLARRLVAALVPPADTLTARQRKSLSLIDEKSAESSFFSFPAGVDREALDRHLVASCSQAGLVVIDDHQKFDSPLYVEARACAAKLRRAQARNSSIVAHVANAFLIARDRDRERVRVDRLLDLRWKRLQKKQSGELKKRKAQAKAQRKSFLPW